MRHSHRLWRLTRVIFSPKHENGCGYARDVRCWWTHVNAMLAAKSIVGNVVLAANATQQHHVEHLIGWKDIIRTLGESVGCAKLSATRKSGCENYCKLLEGWWKVLNDDPTQWALDALSCRWSHEVCKKSAWRSPFTWRPGTVKPIFSPVGSRVCACSGCS